MKFEVHAYLSETGCFKVQLKLNLVYRKSWQLLTFGGGFVDGKNTRHINNDENLWMETV